MGAGGLCFSVGFVVDDLVSQSALAGVPGAVTQVTFSLLLFRVVWEVTI